MKNKVRYQVFVSSTFEDLIEHRKAVLDALHSARHIPAGMEAFPAASPSAWKVITNVIDDSDLYVLIIGGRYGSIDPESKLSYTEKEYHYAVEKGKPVIAFVHGDPDGLVHRNVEQSDEGKEKLKAFLKLVKDRHTVKFWKSQDELVQRVLVAVTLAIQTEDGLIGWVRADGVDNAELYKQVTELLSRIESLTAENTRLSDVIAEYEPLIPAQSIREEIAAMVEHINYRADGTPYVDATTRHETRLELIFLELAGHLLRPRSEYAVQKFIAETIAGKSDVQLHNSTMDRVRFKLLALRMIQIVEHRETADGGATDGWKLTPRGERGWLNFKIVGDNPSSGAAVSADKLTSTPRSGLAATEMQCD